MSKYTYDKDEVIKLNNDDLICKNCVYKTKNAAHCIAYENGKPLSVIESRKCEYYKKK